MEPIQHLFRYDVFLSFRGGDTRTNFTSHLLRALRDLGIEIFHDTSLQRGLTIGPQLLAAIDKSKIFVAVLSTNYADSKWCLDELSHMTDCAHRNAQQTILPIFLDVEKADVSTQQGSFYDPFITHNLHFDQGRVQKWRQALHKAGQLRGLHLQDDADGDERELSEQVAQRVREILHGQNLQPDRIESRLQEVISLLNPVSHDVRVVAICGPAGVGKTTIAKATYERLAIGFKAHYCCLIPDVKTIFREPDGKFTLQKMLISKLNRNNENKIRIDSYHHGIERIQKMMKHQKVLLVLDDVDNVEQLNILGINRSIFGSGSRMIVTTRCESVVHKIKPDATYEPRLLDENESLEVFCLDAFFQNQPKEGYKEVSLEAVRWGAGRPGVLKDAAARLRCFESVQHWEWALKGLMHEYS